MNLTNNFTLEELLASQIASRKGYDEQFHPREDIIENLTLLCINIIQPLREAVGLPIKISSGYRCERVNTAAGGKPTSQHLTGQAADLEFPEISNAYLYQKILDLNMPFDQLIWEFGNDQEPAWVHVSYDPKRHRKQTLKIS